MKKVSKRRIAEHIFVFALFIFILLVCLHQLIPSKSEADHMRWHKEHADITVKEHNNSISEVVSSVKESPDESQ